MHKYNYHAKTDKLMDEINCLKAKVVIDERTAGQMHKIRRCCNNKASHGGNDIFDQKSAVETAEMPSCYNLLNTIVEKDFLKKVPSIDELIKPNQLQGIQSFNKTSSVQKEKSFVSKKSSNSLKSEHFSNSDFIIDNGILKTYKGQGGKVIVPYGVSEIGESAFNGCDSLTSITIPDSVSIIRESAFAH